MSNLRNNLSSILGFFFFILMTSSHQLCNQNVITPAICIYVCLSGNFIFLFLFSLVTLSGTNVEGMFCFQKVSCSFSLISTFLLLPQFHFHEWNWLYYFTKQKIWRSWYISYWSNAYVIEWNRKIFLRLKNKASCERLKRWVEFFSN